MGAYHLELGALNMYIVRLEKHYVDFDPESGFATFRGEEFPAFVNSQEEVVLSFVDKRALDNLLDTGWFLHIVKMSYSELANHCYHTRHLK